MTVDYRKHLSEMVEEGHGFNQYTLRWAVGKIATLERALKWARERDSEMSESGRILSCDSEGVDVIEEALRY